MIKRNLLLLEMPTLMIFHVSFRSECFPTQLASEGFLFGVYPHMDNQIRSLRKRLIAGWKTTSVGLSSIMDMLMCLKSTFARKTFCTVWISTSEPNLFLTR